jgi:hypothetical protein
MTRGGEALPGNEVAEQKPFRAALSLSTPFASVEMTKGSVAIP